MDVRRVQLPLQGVAVEAGLFGAVMRYTLECQWKATAGPGIAWIELLADFACQAEGADALLRPWHGKVRRPATQARGLRIPRGRAAALGAQTTTPEGQGQARGTTGAPAHLAPRS